MYLKVKNDIENNIFNTTVTVDSFGTEQLSEDEEKELLKDFPTKLSYRNLDFKKNIKIEGSVPVVTAEGTSDTVLEVTLPALSNKEILIDENFEATYKIDINRISPSAVSRTVLTAKELVAQADTAFGKDLNIFRASAHTSRASGARYMRRTEQIII